MTWGNALQMRLGEASGAVGDAKSALSGEKCVPTLEKHAEGMRNTHFSRVGTPLGGASGVGLPGWPAPLRNV